MIYLYITNKEVIDYNNCTIAKVRNLIAFIESNNTSSEKSINKYSLGNLASLTYLYIDSKVILTRNYLNISLSNGSTGIVKEITCKYSKVAPIFSKFILIDFGTSCIGNSFFSK